MNHNPQDELVWIVDKENRPIAWAKRGKMREKRLIHRSTYILIQDEKDRMLVQKRTDTKDVYPGLWEIAAGGVVAYGEDYMESALRELSEETGIKGVSLIEHLDFYFEDSHNRLWGRVFSCRYSSTIFPQKEEVQVSFFADKRQMSELLRNEKFTPDSYFLMDLIKKKGITPFDRLL